MLQQLIEKAIQDGQANDLAVCLAVFVGCMALLFMVAVGCLIGEFKPQILEWMKPKPAGGPWLSEERLRRDQEDFIRTMRAVRQAWQTCEEHPATETTAPPYGKGGIMDINEARFKQQMQFTPYHDDQHVHRELLQAATFYIDRVTGDRREDWPWEDHCPTPRTIHTADDVEDLAHAGALIAAEIDRLHRLRARPPKS